MSTRCSEYGVLTFHRLCHSTRNFWAACPRRVRRIRTAWHERIHATCDMPRWLYARVIWVKRAKIKLPNAVGLGYIWPSVHEFGQGSVHIWVFPLVKGIRDLIYISEWSHTKERIYGLLCVLCEAAVCYSFESDIRDITRQSRVGALSHPINSRLLSRHHARPVQLTEQTGQGQGLQDQHVEDGADRSPRKEAKTSISSKSAGRRPLE